MKIDAATIDRAFDGFHDRYVVNARRAWDIEHHVRLWAEAVDSVVIDDRGRARAGGVVDSAVIGAPFVGPEETSRAFVEGEQAGGIVVDEDASAGHGRTA